jgi:multidrug efflux pump subunit AcrA (membrane-fusion protein)
MNESKTSERLSLANDETETNELVTQKHRPSKAPLLIFGSFVVLLVLLLVVVLIWRARKTEQAEEKTVTRVSVKVAKAEKTSIAADVSAVGTIFPREQATVGAKISAQIKSMALLKNKVVKAGEVIAVLESRDLLAQRAEAVAALNQERANERSVTTGAIPQANAQDEKAVRDARAKLTNARAIYQRRRTLFDQGGISKKDLEASELDLTTAENELRLAEQTVTLRTKSLNPNDRALAAAKVAQAEQHLATLDAQLGYATIRAPITGIVTDQFQYEGEFAAAGAKLVNIADISEVIVKAPFADTVAAQLKVGDTADILPTESGSAETHGPVTLISRATDPTNRTVEVWVTLANGAARLRANGAAQVTVSTKSKEGAIVVPTSAVTLEATNANEGTVMVVNDKSVAQERKVTTGIRADNKIEITAGLQEGETVVIEGNFALPDGTAVEVSKDEKDEKPEGGDKKKEEEP